VLIVAVDVLEIGGELRKGVFIDPAVLAKTVPDPGAKLIQLPERATPMIEPMW
jgi:hypothetical protein